MKLWELCYMGMREIYHALPRWAYGFCSLSLAVFALSACSEIQLASHVAKKYGGSGAQSQGLYKVGKPYQVEGRWYEPEENYTLVETGIASWYGSEFHGRNTANGEPFSKDELTAAHRTLQMPSLVRVTNLENGRSIVVRVNDRGPFKRSRVIDLTERGADLLGYRGKGTAKVKLEVLEKESRQIADAARRGVDTRGTEIAMNDGTMNDGTRLALAQPVSEPDISREVPGHMEDGRFMPSPVVERLPVRPSAIYVQAGAFTIQDNATRLSRTLSAYGPARVYPARVGGQEFFRVRLGPYQDVAQADAALAILVEQNNAQAIIVVE